MGDRVNVVIAYDNARGIAFYGHWAGERTPDTVARILKDAKRTDADYFARFAFAQFVRDGYADDASGWTDTLSFGISPYLAGDREYPVLVLRPSDRTVHVVSDREVMTADECVLRVAYARGVAWAEFVAAAAAAGRMTWDVVQTVVPDAADYTAVTW